MTDPRLSVVVPTRNGADTLPALLHALQAQSPVTAEEIIVVDSGSVDDTPAIAAAAGARVLRVAPEDFDHGRTRNLGVDAASGDLVVLTVQDACPASPTLLRDLTAPFEDAAVAGTFARQQPRPDASAITRHYLGGWVATSPTSRTVGLDAPGDLDRLTPTERLDRCAIDNVCACIRREVWQAVPFRATPIAEDLTWGRDVLRAGHRLAYAAEAVVVHSHDRSARRELDRTRTLHRQLVHLFGLRTIPTRRLLVRAVLASLVLHARLEAGQPGQWARAAALAVAWPLGQYLGGRDAAADLDRRGEGPA